MEFRYDTLKPGALLGGSPQFGRVPQTQVACDLGTSECLMRDRTRWRVFFHT